eukprot:TRINITY_DN5049_c2_g1_i1.p1 TRINITY_DN5049_c2_g1~~TRINITY_DN5049_c2_g1_i1.p1  ORF type:complete len:339 (-),score=42.95 TRINITY_DN5049_c2_g1_i1:207-1190(-)
MAASADTDEPDEAPRSSYAGTALFAMLLLLCWITSFILQLACALVTWPLLFCSEGRERFHEPQSIIFRTMNALVVVLNPLWGLRLICQESALESDAQSEKADRHVGTLFFVNHRSNLDPWIVAWVQLRMCMKARYIYKASLAKLPLAGCCVMLAGDLAAHFGDKERIVAMLDRSRRVLSQGYNIVVFPEGTRSPSGMLQDFKPTFFEMAIELGCPVVPVCLFGTERAWPHGGFRMGCANVTAMMGSNLKPVCGQGSAAELMCAVKEAYQNMAAEGLNDGVVEGNDPLVTGRPNVWWKVPDHLQELEDHEVMSLLRSGKAHERGQHLA